MYPQNCQRIAAMNINEISVIDTCGCKTHLVGKQNRDKRKEE